MATSDLKIFGLSFERSRTIAFALFAGMVAFIAVGAAIGEVVGTILAAIGSTLGTTALVSFLYDPFLKEILAKEIFDRVGLRDSIVRAGLEEITRGDSLNLSSVIASARHIHVMPLDPFAWTRESFAAVLGAAKSTETEVIIVLPSPAAGPPRTILAYQLCIGENELERRLKELPEEMAQAWDQAEVAERSTLRVLTQQSLVTAGLLVGGTSAVIETGPSLQQSATDRTSLVQRFRPDSPFGQWASAQLQDAIANATTAILRPVTPSDALPGRHAGDGPGGAGTQNEATFSAEQEDVQPSAEKGASDDVT